MKLLLPCLVPLLLTGLPLWGQTGRVTESAVAWSWNRETRGFEELPAVRRSVEIRDAQDRPLRREIHLKGGGVYTTSLWSYEHGMPVKRDVLDHAGRLQSSSSFKKEKNGLLEYMHRPDGSLFLLFYHKTDASGRAAELLTVDASSNLLTRKKYFYDAAGQVSTTVLYDGNRRPLLVSSYTYEGSDPGNWTIRDEYTACADAEAPREKTRRSASNLARTPAGPATAAPSPRLSNDPFIAMTSNLARGTNPGAKILSSALRKILDKTIIQGSCYDWINLIYNELGYKGPKRQSVFSGKETGPYADPLLLRPGDWIMFKNQTFGDIGHSGIFLGWLDFESRSAIIIGYAGQNRAMPGRFREYDISRLFGIVRGRD